MKLILKKLINQILEILYELFCEFYNKIKIEYYNDDFDDLISSEDSDTD